MKNSFITFFKVFILFFTLSVQNIGYCQQQMLNDKNAIPSIEAKFDYHDLSQLPVMHEGRIKPLSTFANLTLKSVANANTTMLDNKTATEWLIDLMLSPKQDYSKPRFTITNAHILGLLNLQPRDSNLYSFIEILPGIKQNISSITTLETKAANKTQKLQHNEQTLLNLYHSTLVYFDLSRTFTLLLPEFDLEDLTGHVYTNYLDQFKNQQIDNKEINNNQTYNNTLSYYQLLPIKNLLTQKIETLLSKPANNYTEQQLKLLSVAKKLKDINSDRINITLKIIPNQLNSDENWLAPWEVLATGNGSPSTAKYLNIWQILIYSYYSHDQILWKSSTKQLLDYSTELAGSANQISSKHLRSALTIEQIYNQYDLFDKAFFFYLASLLILILASVYTKEFLTAQTKVLRKAKLYSGKAKLYLSKIIFLSYSIAFILHFVGLTMRIYILQRPPVANLYESILFVAFIISVLGCVLETIRKDYIGIFVGSIICSILLFIAHSYAQAGDTLGVIIAVLNNNFWLGTHVLAITSGYGCCLLLSAFAHVYLFRCCVSKSIVSKSAEHNSCSKLMQLNQYILGLGLLSLFFTLLGTILGGIWADQSWGRFWGWDPKENGAMLICLWLIALLHGRISGHLDTLKFVTGCALTSITVALAWFGVNVLGAGLHSYGFTENIATNLVLFIVFELLLVLGLYSIVKLKFMKKSL